MTGDDYPQYSEEYSSYSCDSFNEEMKEEIDAVPINNDIVKRKYDGAFEVHHMEGIDKVTKKSQEKSEMKKNHDVINNTSHNKVSIKNSFEKKVEENSDDEENSNQKKFRLYQSGRLKGYITLTLASVIYYDAATSSNSEISSSVMAGSIEQVGYARIVGFISIIISGLSSLIHLDQCSPLKDKIWYTLFGPKSIVELCLVMFLVLWWGVATGVQTSVRGIAGDGKQQHNLYFSTWCCCYISIWMLERWAVTYGFSSFKSFISSWPYRAPGWIAINVLSFFASVWYIDLYLNRESMVSNMSSNNKNQIGELVKTAKIEALDQYFANIHKFQFQWLLFAGAVTYIPSTAFVLIEIFRETKPINTQNIDAYNTQNIKMHQKDKGKQELSKGSNGHNKYTANAVTAIDHDRPTYDKSIGGKGKFETIVEGFILSVLVLTWIPTVVIATSPGGAASLVGNAYFFTWATSVFVIETFIWFVHDLRQNVHLILKGKENEYKWKQFQVLDQSREMLKIQQQNIQSNPAYQNQNRQYNYNKCDNIIPAPNAELAPSEPINKKCRSSSEDTSLPIGKEDDEYDVDASASSGDDSKLSLQFSESPSNISPTYEEQLLQQQMIQQRQHMDDNISENFANELIMRIASTVFFEIADDDMEE